MEVLIAIYGNEFSFGIVFSVAEILNFPVWLYSIVEMLKC